MIQGFKEFISRGNVVDLAVGVIIGAAFSQIVTALVDGVINPLIGAIFGQPNFDDVLKFTIGTSEIKPGLVLTALVNFLLIAFAIYFCIVMPMNKLAERRQKKTKQNEAEESALTDEAKLLVEIRDLLSTNGSTPSVR